MTKIKIDNSLQKQCRVNPGDFVTKMKQINSQSDSFSMSSFAGLTYLTIRSSVYIISTWDPCIFNLHNLFQTWSSYIWWKPHQRALHVNEQTTKTHHFLLLQPCIRPALAQVSLLCKGPPKLCIECHLVPLWAFPPKSPGMWKAIKGRLCWKMWFTQ